MPTIMEEYIDWQNAGYPDVPTQDVDINNDPHLNIDLTLENAVDDDFSFFALAHYSGPPGDTSIDATAGNLTGETFVPADLTMEGAAMVELPDKSLSPQDCWEVPAVPCANCSLAGYQCKLIREGKYKGYCTSCVALGNECSFGGFGSGSSLATPDIYQPTPWHAQVSNIISSEQLLDTLQNRSTPDLSKTSTTPGEQAVPAQRPPGPGKVGARLSRESIRILRQWLSTHSRHPYPTEEEKEMLQRQTGLARTQITNYLANARRRGKVQPQRATSPNVRSFGTSAMDIPPRKGTPMLEDMNPLQRWEHSPPEHEPASAIAIARAVTASTVTSSSGQASPFSHTYTDDGSTRSIHGSSASSVGTSQGSSGSFASAYSHASRGSFGSFGRGRRRRRRRNAPKRGNDNGKTPLNPSAKTYQCTFCVADFKTKHDWQRHEKSLHLSLERWVCCTHGPRALRPDTNKISCVFCGEPEPDDAHIENHNYSACQDKTLNDRTFYRKDHLNQHLKLVHNVKYADWSMKDWKVATPEIRSRCGFCGIVMDTWSIRVDHLAEHFKTGYSMADWKGDWGFEAPVLNLVENSIPPYLIHNERNSPLPYVAGDSPPESPRNAYELIKLELAYYMVNRQGKEEGLPTDEQLQVEACRIIFASEVLSLQGISSMHSWLRDLVMSSEPLTQQAKFGPLRGQAENRLAILKINGKDNLFEACPLEAQLREFVKARTLLGLTAMDDELQEEACRIVGRMEEVSTNPSDAVANWVVRMTNKSTGWLANFRQRAHLPRSEDLADARLRSTDPSTIDSTIYNYSRLERELGDYVDLQRTLGIEPSDADLQRQARIIIYEFDDGWNQTAADNADWLAAFKRRHLQSKGKGAAPNANTSTSPSFGTSPVTNNSTNLSGKGCLERLEVLSAVGQGQALNTNPYFLNDANCYRRLAKELGRFVAATMSPNNPNQRVPSDEELQHQARWILYDDDDPWNQTAADNAEWLQRFKRDVGIIKDGPGLPMGDSWSVQQGGSGFAPPYAFPKANMAPFRDKVQVPLRDGAKAFEAEPAIANKFLETFTTRYPKPARIFCSRELEDGLVQFTRKEIADTGQLPPDDTIRERAREILGMEATAADDPHLLEKFKTLMLKGDGTGSGGGSDSLSGSAGAVTIDQRQLELPEGLDMGLNISDAEINDIIHDMNFELDMEDVMETM